ncbi:PREDICTED: uncharacterized protein LOC107186037 [Dufourea novaeangliae]|uniref:uncharacterized protein LOC107186037 n=1 Tax=Dufourea novaeangliae TaxID=178035 RepID=UPI000767DA3B|nr:PREDICTED: uncharacterized protein LOC107186037 [Dufourea novaeangliae]
MGSDDEVCEDEDEILVYVEFEGLVDGNVFSEEQLQLDMIGIDSEHPIMQINGKFYEGTYEDVSGTYMFFEKNENCIPNDPVFDVVPNVKYFTKTRKVLKMQRIFIKSRTEVLGDSEHYQCIPNLNTLQQAGVPCQYQEEALSFWNAMRSNRLSALYQYLEKQRIRQQKKSQGIMLNSESDEDNPFAMYKHKEDTGTLNKFEDTCVQFEENSSYYNDQFHSKPTFSKEMMNETLSRIESGYKSSLKNFKTLLNPQSSMLENGGCDTNKSVKTHKTKLYRKKNVSKARNTQRIKDKKTRPLVKGRKSRDKKEEKLLSTEEKSEEPDISNVVDTLNTLEISRNENENTQLIIKV